ncbi:MAG: hypothetical protein OH354_04900 [Candidatus Parvarchaeota archaeon]|nr:hypothetical protein [Candidatus Jingweiarchaeum tengchongense]MCW1309476.1 hypothetical protein [Candidatus Jingweiarchaeum tengchongense]
MEKYFVAFKYGLPNIFAHLLAMQQIKEFYSLLPNYEGKDIELDIIKRHETRPPAWLRNQAFVIWSGNQGYFSIFSKKAMKTAIAYTIAFYAADLKDELCDKYLIPILCSKKFQSYNENKILNLILNTNIQKLNNSVKKEALVLENASDNLLQLTSLKFIELGREAYLLYKKGMMRAFKGQAMDVWISTKLKTNKLNEIKRKFHTKDYLKKIVSVAEEKLGCIGEYAAKITYRLSNGSDKKIENALCTWYKNATTLLQITYDDMREILDNLRERETNPFILAMICNDYKHLSKENLKIFLEHNPELIDNMISPLIEGIKESLKKLEDFNFHDHLLATNMIMKIVDKEIDSFEKKIGVKVIRPKLTDVRSNISF